MKHLAIATAITIGAFITAIVLLLSAVITIWFTIAMLYATT